MNYRGTIGFDPSPYISYPICMISGVYPFFGSYIWPYMVQYLHFRILKFPLTICPQRTLIQGPVWSPPGFLKPPPSSAADAPDASSRGCAGRFERRFERRKTGCWEGLLSGKIKGNPHKIWVLWYLYIYIYYIILYYIYIYIYKYFFR